MSKKFRNTMRQSFLKAAQILDYIQAESHKKTIDVILNNPRALNGRISDLINAHGQSEGVREGYNHRLEILQGFDLSRPNSPETKKAINEAMLAISDYDTLVQHLRVHRPQ